MTEKIRLPGGELEYAVLEALWDSGTASAREIYERVGEPSGLVYTTTAKVLERLRAKGLASRRRSGRMFVYRARVPRDRIRRERTKAALAHLLGSEPRPVMATLVEAVENIDPVLLDELARVIRDRRKIRSES